MNTAATDYNGNQAKSYAAGGSPTLLSATSITGDDVCNQNHESLGSIQDLMLDVETGEIRYAVLASGGFLGMGERLFAVPWSAFTLDAPNKRFILNVDIERLKAAPGFNKDEWPDMADQTWSSSVESYYSTGAPSSRI